MKCLAALYMLQEPSWHIYIGYKLWWQITSCISFGCKVPPKFYNWRFDRVTWSKILFLVFSRARNKSWCHLLFASFPCVRRYCLGKRGFDFRCARVWILSIYLCQTGSTRVQRDLREFSSRWEPHKGRFCFCKSEVLISLQGISVAKADLVWISERRCCQLYRPVTFFYGKFPFVFIFYS
jgi:hypothetical protein